jgi:hypothetical protein
MVSHQISPDLTSEGLHAFRHTFTILGAREVTTQEDWAEIEKEAGLTGESSRFVNTPASERRHNVEFVNFLAVPASHPQALRYLLCGTPSGYPVHNLPLITRQDAVEYWLKDGIPGAFGLQPLFLFDFVQWNSYVQVMNRRPLFRLFGSWRKTLGKSGAAGQNSQLREANRKRARAAQSRRHNLLELARPVWSQVLQQGHNGSAGRPPVRSLLARGLRDNGQDFSHRDLSWLIKKLRV